MSSVDLAYTVALKVSPVKNSTRRALLSEKACSESGEISIYLSLILILLIYLYYKQKVQMIGVYELGLNRNMCNVV